MVIATGARLKQLGVPREQGLEDCGVSYCAICDNPIFQNGPSRLLV
ncbi:hypothetical protein [Methanopyrus sp.]